MNQMEAYSEKISIMANKPEKHYKIDHLFMMEDGHTKFDDHRQMSISPLKDSFLKNQSRSRKEVIYAWSVKNTMRAKRASETV